MIQEPIIHLLKPKEFRVYCRPGSAPDRMDITNKISKATCVNCLNILGRENHKRKGSRRKSHIKTWMVRKTEGYYE